MRGFLLVLLMSSTYVRHITSCPASCVVCSEDAIICQKLSNIIGVPETTKVLILTDGQIDTVDSGNFSDLSNMTLLGLSNNAITNITESAFQNLTVLKVLLLDHNLITSSSIFRSTFSPLQSLEILRLGNNAIRVIDGGWFRHTRSLLTLQLEVNLITRLDSATFQSSNLDSLETLDLSDNLIAHVGRGSFRALPRLRRLDLSRNDLRTAPDAFSYLSWLSALNLDHNQWNCTCELQELSSFLSSYMEAPDKVLYNGRQLVCLSADNPAVQTVLQLTEANCVPPNKNITLVVATKGSISAQQYARDVTLAALFFFAGGVALTVGVLYIFYTKLELKKALGAWRDRNWDDEGDAHLGGTIQNHGLPELSFTGDNKTQVLSITHPGQETKLMSPNGMVLSNQRPWLREGVPSGMGPAIPKHHFVCHRCSPDLGSQRQYQRRQGGQSFLSRQEDVLYHHMDLEHFIGEKQPLSQIRHSPPSHRKAPTPYSAPHGETQTNRTNRDLVGSYSRRNSHTQTIHTLPDYLTVHCSRCLKTHEYRQARSTVTTAETETTTEGTLETRYTRKGLTEPNPNAQPHRERGLNDTESHTGVEGYGGQLHTRNPGMNIPLQRTVTFNLTGSEKHMISAPKKKSLKVKDHKVKSSGAYKLKEKHRASKSNKQEKGDHLKRHKQRVQSNGLLKVKLNLTPFRKNRVHPREHHNQEDVQSKLERAGTVAKKSKLISKDRKIKFKNSRDSHAVSETKKKGSKVSKTDNIDHAKKLIQSNSTEQSRDLSKPRGKSSRPKTSRKTDKVNHTEKRPRDLDGVDQEITESHTPQRKRTKKGRQKELSMEDDATEHQANLVKSEEENSLSLSKSSKRGKNSPETDRDSQEGSAEPEGRKQPQTVNIIRQTSVKDNSNDAARTLELKDEEPLGSGGVPVLQKMSPKEVANKDQPANLELKEGEERPLVPSLNSAALQTQVNFPDTSPTEEAQHAHMLDLGEALVEQKPLLHAGSGSTKSIREDSSIIQEPTALTADETGRELADTMSVEGGTKQSSPGPVRPTRGDQEGQHIPEMDLGQEEPKPLSDQGSTDMLSNQEPGSKFMDTSTVEGEPKKESTPPLGSIQGDTSDGAMMTDVAGTSPQAGVPESYTEPLAHADMDGSSLADPLAAPDTQPVSDQMTAGGPGPTNPLDEENLSNNNSMKPGSSHPIILQEYLPPSDGSPKRKLRLIIPERPRSRPITPLDKKIR